MLAEKKEKKKKTKSSYTCVNICYTYDLWLLLLVSHWVAYYSSLGEQPLQRVVHSDIVGASLQKLTVQNHIDGIWRAFEN